MKEDKIKLDAKRAVEFCFDYGMFGGYALSHMPSVKGIALKYILHARGISLAQASMYMGMSKQVFNYMVNRMSDKKFDDATADRVCKMLKINSEYFNALCVEISKIYDGTRQK